jgi:hypothetical protein
MNFALKSSLTNQKIMNENTSLISQLKNDMDLNKDEIKEIYFKKSNTEWIYAKQFGEREFYVIIDKKNYSLIEVKEHLRKINSVLFKNKK